MPELKHLLIAGSLTPEQVALARKAFDGVWAGIAHLYVGKEAVALGRTRLATMVLAVISEGRTDAADIQQASLTLMEKVEAPVPLERGRKRKS
jgi:hypothetical protein